MYRIVTLFVGEQDTIKVNNLIVAHWLNILCKRAGVSNGVIVNSTKLTSRMQFPTCTFIYRNLSTHESGNWPANSQYLNSVDFSEWDALQ